MGMAGIRSVLVCLLVIVVCGPGHGTKKSYKGYHVVRVTLNGDADWLAVESILSDKRLKLELWSAPSSPHDLVDIQVAAKFYRRLAAGLDKRKIKHEVFIEDVQGMIDAEEESERYELLKDKTLSQRVRRSVTTRISNRVVGKYATLNEIESWMRELDKYLSPLVKLETVGVTYRRRKIYALKVGLPLEGREGVVKPAIYLDGAMHSREWISPATVVYIIYQLLINHVSGVKDIRGYSYLDLLDWYFVPVANPDGYAFTHSAERLWRKNRAPIANSTCIGTDLNRNWPYRWGKEPDENGITPYTSDNPCSIVFQGPGPGSELETKALMSFLLRHNDTIRAFISHHSYTQKWFTRWGYTNSTPPDHQQLLSVAEKAVAAIQEVGGEPYKVGRPFELLYAYTGGSADWAKGVAGIKYSYTVELRDRGRFGFLLPANYVIPVGEELFAAVKVVATQIINETYGPEIERTTHAQTTQMTTERADDNQTKCSSKNARDSCKNTTKTDNKENSSDEENSNGEENPNDEENSSGEANGEEKSNGKDMSLVASQAVGLLFFWDRILVISILWGAWTMLVPS